MTKPKNSCSNLNSLNHKNQMSMSKIPNSLVENKILYSNKLKKNKKSNEEIESRNTLKEFIDNYLDDFFHLRLIVIVYLIVLNQISLSKQKVGIEM